MGLPQGSNLGPLFFSVFINDSLCEPMEATALSFADDSTLIVSYSDLAVLGVMASTCWTRLCSWMHVNGLVLNSNKTKCILFGGQSRKLIFKIHRPTCPIVVTCTCETVVDITDHNYLGLHIDESLTFRNHVDRVCAKMRMGVAALARLRGSCILDVGFSWSYLPWDSLIR